ncbi:redoxin family protein [Dysgonomonas sp. Marseille-P4677]|uniref:peroxiredoxin family protein n=1 Tax=Dysgonomonas sp. Marseille-P4677 TaxID=2364790 RepID=UPI0019143342|nr:thioredoxin-like domain-containing protein [Dysgonomonas sp. Marseille-P4677]MBK5721296.1 redoxin family protein [Dysgonomonas sp. Marseille-P4677]
MKYLKYFLVVGIIFISLSSNTSRTSSLSEGIYPGNLLPDIKNLENESGTKINLSDLRGQKVLVNFWAAYDASSHKDNVLLSHVIEKKNYPVKMLSVSFDKNESVYERTLMMDQIDRNYQFMVKGDVQSDLFKRYQLERGFKNYLLDEKGVIVAMNLSPNDLDQLLNEN